MPSALCDISIQTPVMTTAAFPRSLAEAFAAVSGTRGESIAVRCADHEISYAALARQALSVAQALRERGAGRGSLVAIHLHRGIDMVAAMLGACMAGAAYLPLDPTFPRARVLETLTDARPALLLTEPELAADAGGFAGPTLLIGDALLGPIAPAAEFLNEPDDLAYVIYTSGSTGRPKGVMVSQRNVLRLFTQTAAWFHFDEHDVWTMFHSFAFDFSVWEIWGALLTGGTLVIVPYDTSRSPEAFYELLSRERVTVLNQTPTAFGLLSRAVEAQERPLALRYVIFGGEALNLRSLRPWMQRFGDAQPQLINMYGITETTVHVTWRRILRQDIEEETDSLIGVPIPDLQLHLLDERQQPVTAGEVGEMYIGGAGVALGYLHRPEHTAERFLPDFISAGAGRLYRSGDLARLRPDGELAYLGRADRQVKINGFRVEPGEIEAAIAEFPGIQQVCVTPQSAPGTQFLAAYVVASTTVDRAALAAALADRLPAHMRPTFYLQLPTLPLTANGKVDRDALPRPEVLQQTSAPATGATPLPRQIAGLWATILQVDAISETDNFFDVGGSSLQLLALRAALQQKLGREIPVLWMFEHTSPLALATRLSAAAAQPQSTPAMQKNADRQRQSFARARALRSMPS